MTIRITVNNDAAREGSTVGVRTMEGVDGPAGTPVFLSPGEWQSWYLTPNQFLVVVEVPPPVKRPAPVPPGAPLPGTPEPVTN